MLSRTLFLHLFLPRCYCWTRSNTIRRSVGGINTSVHLRRVPEVIGNLGSTDRKLACSGDSFCVKSKGCCNTEFFSVSVPSKTYVVSLTGAAGILRACASTTSQQCLSRGLGGTALDKKSENVNVLTCTFWRNKSQYISLKNKRCRRGCPSSRLSFDSATNVLWSLSSMMCLLYDRCETNSRSHLSPSTSFTIWE